jgi:hypothetical protein
LPGSSRGAPNGCSGRLGSRDLCYAPVSSAWASRLSGGVPAHEPRYRRAPMPETEPAAELNQGFSEPGAAARPWTDVTGVCRPPRWSGCRPCAATGAARHAAAGHLAGRGAALLRRLARAESDEPAGPSRLRPGGGRQPGPGRPGRGGRGTGCPGDRSGATAAAGGAVEVQARLRCHGHRRRVPRSGWPPGARVRRHPGEGPRVRQEPLQPDPVPLHRRRRHLTPLTAGSEASFRSVVTSAGDRRIAPGPCSAPGSRPDSRSPSVTILERA